MDLQSFKVKNDYAKGIGSGIFEYQNLSDLEKVLFLEHNVTELIALLKRKNNTIKEMDGQMTRIIEEKEESRIVKALKAEITSNHRIIKKYKDLVTKMTGSESNKTCDHIYKAINMDGQVTDGPMAAECTKCGFRP